MKTATALIELVSQNELCPALVLCPSCIHEKVGINKKGTNQNDIAVRIMSNNALVKQNAASHRMLNQKTETAN
jgi:hypothetical protein